MTVIDFEHVTKIYRLGTKTSLREALSNVLTGWFRRNDHFEHRYVKSLDDVSFRVSEGEVLGIIGANGAGKTTTLKLLSKVTYPTKGRISINGRVSALIELGAGFHPDLSGMENIYLNASILGLKSAEVDDRLEQIVEFSGLEKFLDTPVKRYSSGMYARLAFSVAAHVDPDVLLVDEVLSVGDIVFQEKCLQRMKEIRDQGRAMIFVSHNMISVQNICSRVIWLDRGRIKQEGAPGDVISSYLADQYADQSNILELEEGEDISSYSDGSVEIYELSILDKSGYSFETIEGGESLTIKMGLALTKSIQELEVKIYLTDKQRNRLLGGKLSNRVMLSERSNLTGKVVITSEIEKLPVRPNNYYLNLDILDKNRLVYRKLEIGPIIVWSKDQTLMADRFEEFNLFDVRSDWQIQK